MHPGKPNTFRAVVTGLNIYPVKSCRGVPLEEWTLAATGLQYDRAFVIGVSSGESSGSQDSPQVRFLSQRQWPHLVHVIPEVDAEKRVVRLRSDWNPALPPLELVPEGAVPDGREPIWLRIWSDTVRAVDVGGGEWLQQAMDMTEWDASRRLSVYRMASDWERVVEVQRKWIPPEADSIVAFADGYPFLLTSQASLAELNRRLLANGRDEPLPMDRFRPNIVVGDLQEAGRADAAGADSPLQPFEEDRWQRVRIGDKVVLRIAKPCARCRITTTNQFTGEVDEAHREPLQTLGTFRKSSLGVLFGQNFIHEEPRQIGRRIRVGDLVEVMEWRE